MSAFAQKWANWGTPNGVATRIIPSDFSGIGHACPDLGVTALVCRGKVERLCVLRGGPIFEIMGHGIVHFGRGGRFRFFVENLTIFGFCGNPR